MNICHRVNRLEYIPYVYRQYDGIETDVMYNSDKQLVLCHDYDERDNPQNDTLQELADFGIPLRIILDIKTRGISEGWKIAGDIIDVIRGSVHLWDLCSFNELCVQRLLMLNMGAYKIGLISSSLSLSLFTHLDVKFVSLDYGIAGEDLLDALDGLDIEVYIWGIKKKPDLQAAAYIISSSGRMGSSGLPNISQSSQTD